MTRTVDWGALELELRTALRRDVVLLVRPSGHVEGTRRQCSVESLVVEMSYARTARLSIRCDINLHTSSVQVRCVGAYLIDDRSQVVAQPACPPPRLDVSKEGTITPRDALASCIETCLDAYRAAQVASVASCSNERAKFELELLKHVPGVDILVMASPRSTMSARIVVSMISAATTTHQPCHFPEDVLEPCLEDPAETPYIVFSIPLDESDTTLKSWKCSTHYPSQLQLSNCVTEVMEIGTATSSVDVVSSWREGFHAQWNLRREFIQGIRQRAVGECQIKQIDYDERYDFNTVSPVLELDPVDFSFVVILIQLAPTPTTPMILVVVRIQFTREFILTRCLSDLQVSLVDGASVDSLITLHLEANTLDDMNAASNSAYDFLVVLRTSVRKHCGLG